jgi:hypothetical protein
MDLFGTLDAFIGLLTIFLVLSLVVSAVGEGVSTWTRLKGRILVRFLRRLIGPEATRRLLLHPEVDRLAPAGLWRVPSYLPEEIFVDVLLDLLVNELDQRVRSGAATAPASAPAPDPAPGAPDPAAPWRIAASLLPIRTREDTARVAVAGSGPRRPVTVATVDAALARVDELALSQAARLRLPALWRAAGGDLASFRSAVARWFNETGDRSVGWFRRELGLYLFGVGLVVAVALNADTLHMFQRLTQDDALRATYVEQAKELFGDAEGVEPAGAAGAASGAAGETVEPDDGTGTTPTTGEGPRSGGSMLRSASGRNEARDALCRSLGLDDGACVDREVARRALPELLPVVGWDLILDGTPEDERGTWGFWLLKVLGWFLTAAAVSLGAPFWFDLLQKFIRIRSSLKPGAAAGGASAASQEQARDAAPPAARTIVRARAAAPARLADLSGFDAKRFGFERVNLLWGARLAEVAYDRPEEVRRRLEAWNAQVEPFEDAATDTQGFLAWTPTAAWVVFRGSEQKLQDWLTNSRVTLREPPWARGSGVQVHEGFDGALDAVWTRTPPPAGGGTPGLRELLRSTGVAERGVPVWFVGHSLGGALAALAALRFASTREGAAPLPNPVGGLFTYGQPRVGDPACAARLEALLAGRYVRVVNDRDVVPRVPFPDTPDVRQLFGGQGGVVLEPYAHAGQVLYFNGAGQGIVDPPVWYRGLDALAPVRDVAELRERLRSAARETVGDHLMPPYRDRLRALIDAAGAVDEGDGLPDDAAV